MDDDKEFQDAIKERFAQLPTVVQRAITSADVAQRMRELAQKHNLHLDQWDSLENEVQLTLLGIQPSEDLAKNIQSEVGVSAETAASLTEDISSIVFDPIRQELERQLENPNAVSKTTTGVEDMRTRILADASENPAPAPLAIPPVATPVAPAAATVPATPSAPVTPIAPATPPAAASTAKVERAPVSPASYAAAPSHERKTVEGDPYREQIE